MRLPTRSGRGRLPDGARQSRRVPPLRSTQSRAGRRRHPDLGFVRTPRTGTGLTHRVAMLLPADGGDNPPGWADRGSSPRARADPALDAWAGRLLGPATGITAQVDTGR